MNNDRTSYWGLRRGLPANQGSYLKGESPVDYPCYWTLA